MNIHSNGDGDGEQARCSSESSRRTASEGVPKDMLRRERPARGHAGLGGTRRVPPLNGVVDMFLLVLLLRLRLP